MGVVSQFIKWNSYEAIYNLLPNFHVRHEGFSFYGPRKSDEGVDTDLIYIIFAGLVLLFYIHVSGEH